MQSIYVIEYYEKDKHFGWTNTLHNKVLAPSEEKALEKFRTKHPNIKTYFISNIIHPDY